jgi:hypothetical protein
VRADPAAFERAWRRIEEGSAGPREVESELLAMAAALRDLGERIAPPTALDRAWGALVIRLEGEPQARPLRPRHRPARAWALRALAAAAAVAVLLAVSLRARPGSVLYPVRTAVERTAVALDPSLHARLAAARLDDLLFALVHGPVRDAPSLARALVRERAAAVAGGIDVSRLDARISTEVPPALAGAPPAVADEVRAALGPLLPPADLAPSPAPEDRRGPGPAEGQRHDRGGGEEDRDTDRKGAGEPEAEPAEHVGSGDREQEGGASTSNTSGESEGSEDGASGDGSSD